METTGPRGHNSGNGAQFAPGDNPRQANYLSTSRLYKLDNRYLVVFFARGEALTPQFYEAGPGPPVAAGPPGAVAVLPTAAPLVAQGAHHQRHWVLLRRSPPEGSAHSRFSYVESVDRIIYAIFSRFNEDWKNHSLNVFTQAA